MGCGASSDGGWDVQLPPAPGQKKLTNSEVKQFCLHSLDATKNDSWAAATLARLVELHPQASVIIGQDGVEKAALTLAAGGESKIFSQIAVPLLPNSSVDQPPTNNKNIANNIINI